MARDEIMAMEEGPEMDALVVLKVFEWSYRTNPWACRLVSPFGKVVEPNTEVLTPPDFTLRDGFVEVPHYSTDIAAAWEIIHALKNRGLWVSIHSPTSTDDKWVVIAWRGDDVLGGSASESAPLAICRAALMAVLDKEGA